MRQRTPDAPRGDLPEPPAFVSEADGADNKERTGEKTCWWRSPVRFQGEAAAHQERCDHGFARFRTRAGISDTTMSPQVLRHSFALRYLQAGGNPRGLQALLGYEGMVPVRQYLRWQNQLFHNQTQNKSEET